MNEALPDDFLRALVAEFAGETVHAVALSGSFARGAADAYSDLDLVCYTRNLPRARRDRERLLYRDGRLVSVDLQSLDDRLADLRQPAAIRAVPALRRLRILLDRDGALGAVQRAAHQFTWAPLQPAADAYASFTVERLAEVAHKILGGLAARDEERATLATWELALDLTGAVAVGRGVLIDSDRTFFRQVQAAVGRDTAWTRQHRLATGLAAEVTALPPPWRAARRRCGCTARRRRCSVRSSNPPIGRSPRERSSGSRLPWTDRIRAVLAKVALCPGVVRRGVQLNAQHPALTPAQPSREPL